MGKASSTPGEILPVFGMLFFYKLFQIPSTEWMGKCFRLGTGNVKINVFSSDSRRFGVNQWMHKPDSEAWRLDNLYMDLCTQWPTYPVSAKIKQPCALSENKSLTNLVIGEFVREVAKPTSIKSKMAENPTQSKLTSGCVELDVTQRIQWCLILEFDSYGIKVVSMYLQLWPIGGARVLKSHTEKLLKWISVPNLIFLI